MLSVKCNYLVEDDMACAPTTKIGTFDCEVVACHMGIHHGRTSFIKPHLGIYNHKIMLDKALELTQMNPKVLYRETSTNFNQ